MGYLPWRIGLLPLLSKLFAKVFLSYSNVYVVSTPPVVPAAPVTPAAAVVPFAPHLSGHTRTRVQDSPAAAWISGRQRMWNDDDMGFSDL